MLTKDEHGRYISILADGKFHETVPMGTEDAVEREYETSDGKKGTKWEMVYSKLTAKITGVYFKDSDYGQTICLDFEGDEGKVTVQVGTDSNFGTDIMKKLPNIDLSKDVTIQPYAFVDEGTGKHRRGVSIMQGEVKINDHFRDFAAKTNLHGFPNPAEDTSAYDKDDWKMYFMQVKKFLVKYTQENVCPKLTGNKIEHPVEYPKAEIDSDSIPF